MRYALAGLFFVLLAMGCSPIDPGPDIVYSPAADVRASYQLILRNKGKAPVLVQIDQHPPIQLTRWRFATLPRGPHLIKLTTPVDPAFANAHQAQFVIDRPGELHFKEAATATATEDQPIRYHAQYYGRAELHSTASRTAMSVSVRFDRFSRVATVYIDDYPPLYVQGTMEVAIPAGYHRVRAVTAGPSFLTGRNFGVELSRGFNFDRPGVLEIYEATCHKDKHLQGLHYPWAAGQTPVVQTYTITFGNTGNR